MVDRNPIKKRRETAVQCPLCDALPGLRCRNRLAEPMNTCHAARKRGMKPEQKQ